MTSYPAPAAPPAPGQVGSAPPPPSLYSSPIPVRPTHLGHAIASEWTKLRTVRSTMWSFGIMFVLVVGIGLLMTTTVGEDEYDSSPILSFGLPGVLLGQLAVVTLGVLVMTSEYSTGMIRTTLTACPQRGRILTAKAFVFFVVTLVVCTAAAGIVALFNWSELSDRPLTDSHVAEGPLTEMSSASTDEMVRATLGVGLYMALLGLLALSVGVLLRHTAGAVTTMLGVLLLPLLISMFIPKESVQDKLQEYSAINFVADLYDIPMHADSGHGGWRMLGILAIVTAAVLGSAYAALGSRDV